MVRTVSKRSGDRFRYLFSSVGDNREVFIDIREIVSLVDIISKVWFRLDMSA